MKKRYILLIAFVLISIILLSWAMWHVIDPLGARIFQVTVFPSRDAILSLGELGDPLAGGALAKILMDRSADSPLRTAAATALAELPDPAVAALLERVVEDRTEEEIVRESAVEALLAIDPKSDFCNSQARRIIRADTYKPNLADRLAVTPLVQMIAGDDEERQYDPDYDRERRIPAALALAKIGNRRAVKPLLVLLTGGIPPAKMAAAAALGRMKERRAVAPLKAILAAPASGGEETDPVRDEAAAALARIEGAKALESLLQTLRDGSLPAKAAVVSALEMFDDDRAVETLLAMVTGKAESPETVLRNRAAVALGQKGVSEAAGPLAALLQSNDASARAAGAIGLGRLGDRRAVAPLLQALKDPAVDWGYREAAARVLDALHAAPTSGSDYAWYLIATYQFDSFAELDAEAVEPLIAALLEKQRGTWSRYWAAHALGRIGDSRAVEPLIAVLEDKTAPRMLRSDTAEVLGRLADPRAVEPLIAALADARIREEVAKALGCLGDARAADPLIGVLKDKDQFVAEAAAEALGKLRDPRAVEPLIPMLKHKSRYPAEAAAEALGELGDRRAVEPLIGALAEPRCVEINEESQGDSGPVIFRISTDDRSVAEAAAESLGKLGDSRAVEPLIAVVEDCTSSARGAAALALGKLKDPRATGPLFEAMSDLDPEATRALGLLGDSADVETLVAMRSHSSRAVQLVATLLLTKVDDPRVLDPLLDVFKDESHAHIEFKSMVVWWAIAADGLAKFKDARIVEALIPILESYNERTEDTVDVRWIQPLVIALANQDDPRAVNTLITALDGPGTPKARIAAADGLARIGDPKAVEPLTVVAGRASDPEEVRAAAREAIEDLKAKMDGETLQPDSKSGAEAAKQAQE